MKAEVTADGFSAAGRDSHCSVHRNTVVKLAHTYRSPLLFCDLEVRMLVMQVQREGSQHTVGISGTLPGGSLGTQVSWS